MSTYDPDAILANPDAHPKHVAYALINIGIRDRGEHWAKCLDCGDPYQITEEWGSSEFCSAEGSVIRRRRISCPSVVGRTISALWSVPSRASAFIGDNGCALSTPLFEGWGTIAGRRLSRCFSVTQSA